jgi:ribosomal protein S18 acetylase RimI-like enzyme
MSSAPIEDGNRLSDKITRQEEAELFEVQRCSDVSRAAELHAFTQGVFGALDIDPPSGVLKETAADFAARLRDETCFIIEADSKLIASIFCAMDGDALYIGRLTVAPAFRRRGIANALMEAAKAEAKRRGAKRITLGARIALPGNVALFRRHGFAIVRETCHPGFTTPTSYDMELALT